MIPGSTTLNACAHVVEAAGVLGGVVDILGVFVGFGVVEVVEEEKTGVGILLLGSTIFSKKKACFLNF